MGTIYAISVSFDLSAPIVSEKYIFLFAVKFSSDKSNSGQIKLYYPSLHNAICWYPSSFKTVNQTKNQSDRVDEFSNLNILVCLKTKLNNPIVIEAETGFIFN